MIKTKSGRTFAQCVNALQPGHADDARVSALEELYQTVHDGDDATRMQAYKSGALRTVVQALDDPEVTSGIRYWGFPLICYLCKAPLVLRLVREDDEEYRLVVKLLEKESQNKTPDHKAVLALLNVADEITMNDLKVGQGALAFVMQLFYDVFNIKDHWKSSPVLTHVRSLAVRDENRAVMFEMTGIKWKLGPFRQGVYDILGSLLDAWKDTRDEEDWDSMIRAIESLGLFAFDNEPLQLMRSNTKLLKLIDATTATSGKEPRRVKHAAQTLAFKLKENERKLVQVAKPIDAKKIMISYSWSASLELARLIDAYLSKRGFHIWRDENLDAMKGNILEAMANAIDSSQVVLILVTRAYKDSLNCQAELTYARRQKKKIIPIAAELGFAVDGPGWLGMALGGLLFYDVTNHEKLLESQLDVMIAKELHDIDVESTSVKFAEVALVRRTNPPPNDETEIRVWLSANELNDVADILIGEGFVDAKSLKTLCEMTAKDIKESLIISLAMAIRLKNAWTAL